MDLDWNNLGFSYMDTKSHIRYTWKDGSWDGGALHTDPHMNIHIAATALHYGQAAFEGLKAFTCKDGAVRIFRLDENCKRMANTANRIMMPEVPQALFQEAIMTVVRDNIDYVPPYGSGGALYIRPLLFGTGSRIGLRAADEYTFLVLVIPVGDYYKGGLEPVSALVMEEYDRAAPLGTGSVKIAGNYAPSLLPQKIANDGGYDITLYLDAKEHRYIDEFATSNFIAIDADGAYLTPDSPSILPSITNMTLMTLAEEKGLPVKRRRVLYEEIPGFKEVCACGTAVVLTPVNRFVRGDSEVRVGPADGAGPVFQDLYTTVRAIHTGEVEDAWGWMTTV